MAITTQRLIMIAILINLACSWATLIYTDPTSYGNEPLNKMLGNLEGYTSDKAYY